MMVRDLTGQSTKETCLSNFILEFSNPGTSHIGLSSFPLPYALQKGKKIMKSPKDE
jgi:hypothetical protein